MAGWLIIRRVDKTMIKLMFKPVDLIVGVVGG